MGFHHAVRSFFIGIDRKDGPIAPVTRVDMLRQEGPRHYLKAIPTARATGKRPLVVVLHGSGASAEQVLGLAFPFSPLSVWLEIAEREQVIVVAPDGSKGRGQRAWNDGFAGIAGNPQCDDVGFISAVIDRAIAEDGADPERVYVIGVSSRFDSWCQRSALKPRRHTGASWLAWRESPSSNARAAPRGTPGAHQPDRQVVLLKIIGGGHAEPSRKKRYPGLFSRFPGRQSADVEIAEEAWAFFKDKRRSESHFVSNSLAEPLQ